MDDALLLVKEQAMDKNLRQRVMHWIENDPDPVTRDALTRLLAQGDGVELDRLFSEELSFGTAGLRAALGPGPSRMNRVVIRRATRAVALHINESHRNEQSKAVVVGYDGRYGSRRFAEDAACVFVAHGFLVYLSDKTIPTPQLAYALLELKCRGGVMVTASHNPPSDNGYKVFWSDGAQIITPHDRLIAAHIETLSDLGELDIPDFAKLVEKEQIRSIPTSISDDYVQAVLAQRVHTQTSNLKVVYSAMHGVGWPMVERVLSDAGYHQVFPVIEQRDPDPDFSTVKFPNPEEPGAMDLALSLAAERGADLVVANDPDADRLAVALPNKDGHFHLLSGNQVGCLLANYLLTKGEFHRPLVVTTIVSTRMLSYIASKHGAAYKETLTGFKWLAHEAIKVARDGGQFVLGFEEALGYSVGPVVRDKDGISALLQFCDLVSYLQQMGMTVWDQLEALYREHGFFYNRQHSLKRPGLSGRIEINTMMETLRAASPRSLGGVALRCVKDFARGREVITATGEVHPIALPESNVLAFELEDGGQVLVRPSGTEPKIKFYFEVRETMLTEDTLEGCQRRCQERVGRLQQEILTHCGLHD